jgi:tetratricopeptide (TPR) repeat protein
VAQAAQEDAAWQRELGEYRTVLTQTLDPQLAKTVLGVHSWKRTPDDTAQRSASEASLEALIQTLQKIDTPTAQLLRQDAWCQIVAWFLHEGRYLEGLARAENAIEANPRPSIFLANLLLLRARAFELLERYDEVGEAYYEALQINRQLMERSLGE